MMSIVTGTDKNGNSVEIEFGRVPYLKRMKIASELMKNPSSEFEVSSTWGHRIAELAVISPAEFSKNPTNLWECSDETIGRIHEHIRENYNIVDFCRLVLGKKVDKEAENQ